MKLDADGQLCEISEKHLGHQPEIHSLNVLMYMYIYLVSRRKVSVHNWYGLS
jgi:hypothetical protein